MLGLLPHDAPDAEAGAAAPGCAAPALGAAARGRRLAESGRPRTRLAGPSTQPAVVRATVQSVGTGTCYAGVRSELTETLYLSVVFTKSRVSD